MKIKKILIGLLLLSNLSLTAQTIKIEKSYPAVAGSEIQAYYPVFNEAGNKLLFTSEDYNGLNLYDFASRSIQKITDEAGSGYDPVFGAGGDKIVYKSASYKQKLKYEELKSFNLKTAQTEQVIAPQRNLKKEARFAQLRATSLKTSVEVWSEDLKLNVLQGNKHSTLDPVEGATGYLWASLSPDGKKILFYAITKGLYVCDLQGKILASLGNLLAPVWYGNNYVVGMQEENDGYRITASKVMMTNLDGKVKKQLSAPGQIAMYPAASSDAKKVAYNTISGDIYIVELTITE
ncbi:hypothetical protein FACS1894182_07640 [Bacteroidia bacterium]|nr:hypothetical protein FACS1894182_07640 [Bacteroidia bacterium]